MPHSPTPSIEGTSGPTYSREASQRSTIEILPPSPALSTAGTACSITSDSQPLEAQAIDPSQEGNRIINRPDVRELTEKELIFEVPGGRYVQVSPFALFSSTPDIVVPVTLEEGFDSSFREIPAFLDSPETLEYIGFTMDTALLIFQAYLEGGVQYPVEKGGWRETMVEFALQWVEEHGGDILEDCDEKWLELLGTWGIHAKTISWIMDPEYKTVRLEKSCKSWIKELMVSRYATLEDIQSSSHWRINNQAGY